MSDIEKSMKIPSHYERKYTPALVISVFGLNFHEGNAIKYLSRWDKKNGIEDLKKALHYIEMIRDGYQRPRPNEDVDIQKQDFLSFQVRASSPITEIDGIEDALRMLDHQVRFSAANNHQSYQEHIIRAVRFESPEDGDAYRKSYGRIGDFAANLLEIQKGFLSDVASGIVGCSLMLQAGHCYLPPAFPEIDSNDYYDRASALFSIYNALAVILAIEIDRLTMAQGLERSNG